MINNSDLINFLFHFSAVCVLPFWALMIFFPNLLITQRLIKSPWIILPPIFCYAVLLIPNLSLDHLVFFKATSPETLASILNAPWAAGVFWAYAGAFDLFVGRWMFLDSRDKKIKHRYMVLPLAVSIFFGPLGFLIYGALRLALSKQRRSF